MALDSLVSDCLVLAKGTCIAASCIRRRGEQINDLIFIFVICRLNLCSTTAEEFCHRLDHVRNQRILRGAFPQSGLSVRLGRPVLVRVVSLLRPLLGTCDDLVVGYLGSNHQTARTRDIG